MEGAEPQLEHTMRHTPSLFLSLLMLGACGGSTDETVNPEMALSRFDSCAAMEDHLTESFLFSLTNSYGHFGGIEEDIAVDSADSSGGGDSAPSEYSTTNVQEKGVDEADLVKTDGEHVYVLTNGVLSIIDSWPASEAKLIGELDLESIGRDGYVSEDMFLFEDRILVFSREWSERDSIDKDADIMVEERTTWVSQTGLIVIDISDRSAPKVVQEKLVDGNLVSARMIGSDVYTVLSNRMSMPSEVYSAMDDIPWWIWESMFEGLYADGVADRLEAREKLKDIFRPMIAAAVKARGAEAFLPQITHEDGSTDAALSCTDILHSMEISNPGLTTVAHIDLADDEVSISAEATGVMMGSSTVYASQENLYVAQSSYGWWDGISPIERETRIHRVALDGDRSSYEATGVVGGYLHNQFSMSEHKGMLRVATTYDDWWWGTDGDDELTGNNVFILDATQSQMGLIGAVTGLAPGERIYSTRFQGDRAFMVTFVQIDPLFTLDLSNPTAPEAVGELKIPGYSSYLHPIGEDHVLGVGMDGDWDGRISGVAISLFDVSDFSDPTQQDQLTLECDDSWSEALWNHHAILVYGDIVAIPAYGYTRSDADDFSDDWGGYSYESGLVVAEIDVESGLERRGFVNHRPLVEEVYCDGDGEDCDSSYVPQMRRSLVIEGHLFSISELGVMVSKVDDPETPLTMVPLL